VNVTVWPTTQVVHTLHFIFGICALIIFVIYMYNSLIILLLCAHFAASGADIQAWLLRPARCGNVAKLCQQFPPFTQFFAIVVKVYRHCLQSALLLLTKCIAIVYKVLCRY
jgi:hypothetical protein